MLPWRTGSSAAPLSFAMKVSLPLLSEGVVGGLAVVGILGSLSDTALEQQGDLLPAASDGGAISFSARTGTSTMTASALDPLLDASGCRMGGAYGCNALFSAVTFTSNFDFSVFAKGGGTLKVYSSL